MKRYARCPVCGARALVEYGNVLREHSRPTVGAGGVRSICHGRPAPTTPPLCDRIAAEPSGEAVQVGGARGADESSTVQE